MVRSIRRLVGKALRKAGWERTYPLFLESALGHRLFPAELGRIYQQYNHRHVTEFVHGDLGLVNQLAEGQIVLDLGANVGFYTLLFARQVGPRGRVFSFEPGPQSFALLSRNVAMNGYDNVTLVNKAVADKNEKTKFFLCRTGESDNRLYDASTPLDKRDAIDVDVVAVDDYLGDIRVDFVKIDVQGSEYLVLRGMRKLIANNRHIRIAIEYSPILLESAGVSPADFLAYIRSVGLKIHILYEDRAAEETTDENLLNLVGRNKAFSYVDLLLQQ